MAPSRILIVDDEPAITSALTFHFSSAGYQTIVAQTGNEAIEKLAENPDIVILDIMLPDIDGYQVCQRIREQTDYIPILMLTAKDTLAEKVVGLELGADAYLTKPYHSHELLAQVRALLRMAKQQEHEKIVCGPLELWCKDGVLKRNGNEVALTVTEFDLLSLLMRSQGQVLGRETLLRKVWGYSNDLSSTRTVDTHIQRLRSKIEESPENPIFLLTVRGFGYRFVCPDNA